MDYRALVVLSVRTVGLVLLVHTVATAPGYVAAFVLGPQREIPVFIGVVIAPIVVPLVFGLLLLMFPSSSTRVIVGEPFAAGTEFERLLQPILFAGIGLYYLVRGLIDVAYYLSLRVFDDGEYGDLRLFANPDYSAGFISTLVELAAGGALVLGSRGMSRLVTRLRNGLPGSG